MLVDSHCHLNYPDFMEQEGIAEIISRAKSVGVGHMLTICTKLEEFPDILKLTDEFDILDCTVGTHPHHADEGEALNVTTQQLVDLAQHPRVVGIGETGLDYFYETAPKEEQKESLIKHIHACLELDLPIIIHARDADDDMARILKEEGQGKLRGVMHCFSSGRGLAEAALDLGLYISMSGIVTFKNAEDLREIVREVVPLDRLLVETDAPYLAPIPNRGKRNEPSFVIHTAEKVAELKGNNLDEIVTATTDNFYKLFTKSKRRVLI